MANVNTGIKTLRASDKAGTAKITSPVVDVVTTGTGTQLEGVKLFKSSDEFVKYYADVTKNLEANLLEHAGRARQSHVAVVCTAFEQSSFTKTPELARDIAQKVFPILDDMEKSTRDYISAARGKIASVMTALACGGVTYKQLEDSAAKAYKVNQEQAKAQDIKPLSTQKQDFMKNISDALVSDANKSRPSDREYFSEDDDGNMIVDIDKATDSVVHEKLERAAKAQGNTAPKQPAKMSAVAKLAQANKAWDNMVERLDNLYGSKAWLKIADRKAPHDTMLAKFVADAAEQAKADATKKSGGKVKGASDKANSKIADILADLDTGKDMTDAEIATMVRAAANKKAA